MVNGRISISIGYDKDGVPADYSGEMEYNYYGKLVPKSVHGYENLDRKTASTKLKMPERMSLPECFSIVTVLQTI